MSTARSVDNGIGHVLRYMAHNATCPTNGPHMIGQRVSPHPRLPTGGTCAWYPSQHYWDISLLATCADLLPRPDPGVLRHDGTNAGDEAHAPDAGVGQRAISAVESVRSVSAFCEFQEHESFEEQEPPDQVGCDARTDVLGSSHCAPRERPPRRTARRTPPQLTIVHTSRTPSKESDGRTRQRPGPSRRPPPVTTL
ncbi:predicted protein [Postia placenta Mad-698-R]|nr:predicted protein [Postia placenta Mad-698-R]